MYKTAMTGMTERRVLREDTQVNVVTRETGGSSDRRQ